MNWKFYSVVVIMTICIISTIISAFYGLVMPTVVLGMFSLILIVVIFGAVVSVHKMKYNNELLKEFKKDFDNF